jgi:hypothetical protein
MPDTGGRREINQRVEARENETASESKRLLQRSKLTKTGPDLKQAKWKKNPSQVGRTKS